MGHRELLARLVAEGQAEKENPKQKKPLKPTGPNKDLPVYIEKAAQAEKDAKAKANPDREPIYCMPGQIEPLKELSCPVCQASRGEKCILDDGEGIGNLPYVHFGRKQAFATTKGLWPKDLDSMPWRDYPHADTYKRWAIFTTGNQGQPHKKHQKKFKLYDNYADARERADKATEESRTDGTAKYASMGTRYAVCPMVKAGVGGGPGTPPGGWVRADLATEGMDPKDESSKKSDDEQSPEESESNEKE